MASLIDNLIATLEKELEGYEKLLEISREKTPVIIKGEVDTLAKITEEEQNVLDYINRAEALREECMRDIANVLNTDVDNLKIDRLIKLIGKSPAEAARLSEVRMKLKNTLRQMDGVNKQNNELLQNALEMLQFDIDLMNARKMAPQSANYNRGAYASGATLGVSRGRFDTRQ